MYSLDKIFMHPELAWEENINRFVKGKRWLTGKVIRNMEANRRNKLKRQGVENPEAHPEKWRLDLAGNE